MNQYEDSVMDCALPTVRTLPQQDEKKYAGRPQFVRRPSNQRKMDIRSEYSVFSADDPQMNFPIRAFCVAEAGVKALTQLGWRIGKVR